jgi:hypothetical protein
LAGIIEPCQTGFCRAAAPLARPAFGTKQVKKKLGKTCIFVCFSVFYCNFWLAAPKRSVGGSRCTAQCSRHQVRPPEKRGEKMLSLSVLFCPFVSLSVISARPRLRPPHAAAHTHSTLGLGLWPLDCFYHVKELPNSTTSSPRVMFPGNTIVFFLFVAASR